MYKVVEGGYLTWTELTEVLLDVEAELSRRPLDYVEDNPKLQTLTPVTFFHQRICQLQEARRGESQNQISENELSSEIMQKYLITKVARRASGALREKHKVAHKMSKIQQKEGDAVLVKTKKL